MIYLFNLSLLLPHISKKARFLALELDKLRKLELAEFRRECEELDKHYPNAYEAADLVHRNNLKKAKKVKLWGDMFKVFILF